MEDAASINIISSVNILGFTVSAASITRFAGVTTTSIKAFPNTNRIFPNARKIFTKFEDRNLKILFALCDEKIPKKNLIRAIHKELELEETLVFID
jgi:hypothetical protein